MQLKDGGASMLVVMYSRATEEHTEWIAPKELCAGHIEVESPAEATRAKLEVIVEEDFTGGHTEGRDGDRLFLKIYKREGNNSPYVLISFPAA